MSKTYDKNLNAIKGFFYLIYKEGNASRQEVYNFLRECLRFVFVENNLNLDDFDIQFHFINEEDKFIKTNKQIKKEIKDNSYFLNGFNAIMQADDKNPKKFDVYFPSKFASFKISEPFKYKQNEDKDIAFECFILQFEDYFGFIFTAFHEFGHIIQYITESKQMNEYDKKHSELDGDLKLIKKFMPNSKEKRLIIKTIEQHIDASNYVAPYEEDADSQATYYYSTLLITLLEQSENEFFDFLAYNLDFVENVKPSSKNTMKVQQKIYNKTSLKLDKLYYGNAVNDKIQKQLFKALSFNLD